MSIERHVHAILPCLAVWRLGTAPFAQTNQPHHESDIADFAAGTSGSDVIDVAAIFSSFGKLTAPSRRSGDDVVVTLD